MHCMQTGTGYTKLASGSGGAISTPSWTSDCKTPIFSLSMNMSTFKLPKRSASALDLVSRAMLCFNCSSCERSLSRFWGLKVFCAGSSCFFSSLLESVLTDASASSSAPLSSASASALASASSASASASVSVSLFFVAFADASSSSPSSCPAIACDGEPPSSSPSSCPAIAGDGEPPSSSFAMPGGAAMGDAGSNGDGAPASMCTALGKPAESPPAPASAVGIMPSAWYGVASA
mmetsp:Transcript_166205/g.533581  ORF Transcript_166205/g.533581 Transcript_166205/m.533581 type:complete len:234 (+) Transcript_166205:1828-2529(+)